VSEGPPVSEGIMCVSVLSAVRVCSVPRALVVSSVAGEFPGVLIFFIWIS